jgi:cobaltochelatase CobN
MVALPPDRGRSAERRADYHDPALPPRHALVAFGLWLRNVFKADALVHMGAHGTLEWLPGKAVALTAACFPEAIVGALPVFYPFIVSNPGEAAQAKRRIAAVTIGHLPPPLVATGLSGDALRLEWLVDEYAQADGLDRKRRERLATLIIEAARQTGLGREAGIDTSTEPDEVLRRIDSWLCDLKDLSIKDGLHVYGRAPEAPDSSPGADPSWQTSAAVERTALLAALDGGKVVPGPAGAPMRGRRDVLPTGRNLFTADPRMLPTSTAMEFGRLAAAEVVRCHLQTHGEMPRAIIIDLWGSATLRTGGEEIAQGLSLMGCRPTWDPATGRVTGIEVLPPAAFGRPRVDVTWRISGLFRDLFPAQIALIDAAVRAIAVREETEDENPLAAACRGGPEDCLPARVFGTAPGAYGAGVEDLIGREVDRSAIGAAYLASASHAYGGPEGAATPMPDKFIERVAGADLLVHPGDDPGRDLLEGAEDVAFVGGFAAAAAALGRTPDLIMLDVTDPQRPRARPLDAAIARIVRARAINPRFITGQMRHGPRGAAELAETVDRLIGFAQTTDAVASALIDLVHEAYLADPQVRAFLLRENPAAAHSIAERLDMARRNGWWHPRRNDIDADLRAVMADGIMNASRRRGACPGLSAPMPTGDGLLVRLMPAEPVPLDAFVGFCEAARQHGNGTIEISARGSLQVRGLTPHSAPLFASAIAELGIVSHEGVPVIAGFDPAIRRAPGSVIPGRHRQVASPESITLGQRLWIPGSRKSAPRNDAEYDSKFKNVELVNIADTAAELRRALADAGLALSPKVSVVVDGGGPLHLDALSADIRLRAVGPAQLPRFCVGLGGDGASATWVGSIAPTDVVGTVLGLLAVIAAHGPAVRAADILRAEGVGAFHTGLAAPVAPPSTPPQRMPAEMVGLHAAYDGTTAVGIGLAFGHSQADTLAELVRIAAGVGARAVRPAPDRAMLLNGVVAKDAVDLTTAAEQLGFVVRANDPRRRVAACPGAPACASGLIPARALASALTPTLEPFLGTPRNGVSVHISGCHKGCAHPMPAALTLVGTPRGCGIVHNDAARATPNHYVDPANLAAEISRIVADTSEAAHG